MNQFAISANEELDLETFFGQIRSFVGWTDSDAHWMTKAWPRVAMVVDLAVDDFYSNLFSHEFTHRVMTGGQAQVLRLKKTLKRWLETLFSGHYDLAFAESRWRVGQRHVEIGLNQAYAMGALARLRLHINSALVSDLPDREECPSECCLAVNKMLDIDSAIIQFAYQQHYERSIQRAAEDRMQHQARLASIGQMVTGLAHESRNALQRSGACLEALLLEIDDRPEAIRQAQRIQNALDHLNVLYEEVRNYAAPIRLDVSNVRIDRLIERVWQNLSSLWQDAGVSFEGEGMPDEKAVHEVDSHRMEQVLTNLIQNAIQAAGTSGRVKCCLSHYPDDRRWQISIEDNGPGIPISMREKIFEPFFTTKSKGTGLGLAITRRIIEAHEGTITVDSGADGGARFTISMPWET